MEDKEKKFDEMYRKQLEEFKLPVSDKVLANIQGELRLTAPKSTFGFGKLLLSIAIVGGVALAGYFMIHKNNSTIKSETKIKTNETVTKQELILENSKENKINSTGTQTKSDVITTSSNTAQTNEKGAATNSDENKSNLKGAQTNASGTINNSIGKQTNSIGTQTNSNEAKTESVKTNANSVSTQKNLNETKSSSKVNANNSSGTPTNSNETKSKPSEIKSTPTELNASGKETGNNNISNSSAGNTSKQINNTNADSSVLSASTANEDKKEATKDETKTTDSKEVKTGTNKDSVQNKPLAKADSIKPKTQATPLIDDKSKSEKNTHLFVGISGGVSDAFRTLNVGNNSGAQNRTQNEKSIVTYNSGIEVGATIKNKLIAAVGFRISNFGEKYNYSNSSVKISTRDSTYQDTLGVIHTIVLDTIRTPIKNNYTVQNNYQFLTIPILIGYKINIGDKWFVAPCIGANFNYLLHAGSTWFDTRTGQQIDYVKATNFNMFSFSGTFKLEVGINIKEKWSVIFQPEYTRWFQSIYKKSDEIKLYPYSYNFNMGVRYKF